MGRYDPAGTSHTPAISGPKSAVDVAWRAKLPSWFTGFHSPICVDNTLYVAGNGIVAVSAGSGQQLFATRGPAQSPPARAKSSIYRTDTLVVASNRGPVGFNGGGGLDLPLVGSLAGTRWRVRSDDTSYFTSEPVPPVTVDGTAYVILPETDQLAAIDATDGSILWETDRQSPDAFTDVSVRPVVANETVYTVTQRGSVRAVDAATGVGQWQTQLDVIAPRAPTATGDGVVVPTREGMYYLDGEDGAIGWHRELAGNATEGSAAVDDETVYWTNGNGMLYALALQSGETQWSRDEFSPDSPVVADGVVYVSHGDRITALDATDGAELFEYTGRFPLSPTIVQDGRLYHVDQRHLVALEATQ
jgi:outer membrane protein assembly factor BamB